MRAALTALVLVAASVALLGATGNGDGDDGPPRFWLELDNAFGVVEGGDVKIAGVRAGKVTDLELDTDAMRAKVGFELDREGFSDLRTDTFCEVRPQSLIGEYFIDCLPGTATKRLEPGATIPVTQTGATVPADLVANVLRRPYRERFSLILAELGTAVAARGEDLNVTIRRASPALRATQQTLKAIADERRALRDLVTDARGVVEALSDRRRDVSRFVVEARDTARISARREDEIAAQWRALPGFLRELGPTMTRLGAAADRTTPALSGLRRQATSLDTLLRETVPFLERSRPFTRSLARLGAEGNRGVRQTTARMKELAAFAKPLPEVAGNLEAILEHLDNRDFAVEKDGRSPGGKGFTGLEALMRYVWVQQQASNLYDGNSYIVKTATSVDPQCTPWASAAQAREEARKRCRSQLGPSRPGIDTPDPTLPQTRAQRRRGRERGPRPSVRRPVTDLQQLARPGGAPQTDIPALGPLPDLLDRVTPGRPAVPEITLPPRTKLPPLSPRSRAGDERPFGALLDYLLGA